MTIHKLLFSIAPVVVSAEKPQPHPVSALLRKFYARFTTMKGKYISILFIFTGLALIIPWHHPFEQCYLKHIVLPLPPVIHAPPAVSGL